eukprot:11164430-Lingulodinium_polyedra.AAC.1
MGAAPAAGFRVTARSPGGGSAAPAVGPRVVPAGFRALGVLEVPVSTVCPTLARGRLCGFFPVATFGQHGFGRARCRSVA